MALSILLDARKLGDGGIGVYIENLLDGFRKLSISGEASFTLSALVRPSWRTSEAVERWGGDIRLHIDETPPYSLSEYVNLPRRHAKAFRAADIFHSPHYTLPFQRMIPSVVTVHDIIHVTHPERMSHRLFAKPMIRSAIRRADAVITVSEHSRRMLTKAGLLKRIQAYVIPNAVPSDFLERGKTLPSVAMVRGVSKSYCAFMGSERPHKGFEEMLIAWTLLDVHAPDLVLVGSRYSSRARARVQELGLSKRVHFVGELSRRELVELVSRAEAVVIPSREEGFGLPALEAMAGGTAVICSPNPAMREVCGSSGWYAESYHPKAFADVLQRCFEEERLREEKIAVGKIRAAQFTQEATARATLAVYAELLGRERLHQNSAVSERRVAE